MIRFRSFWAFRHRQSLCQSKDLNLKRENFFVCCELQYTKHLREMKWCVACNMRSQQLWYIHTHFSIENPRREFHVIRFLNAPNIHFKLSMHWTVLNHLVIQISYYELLFVITLCRLSMTDSVIAHTQVLKKLLHILSNVTSRWEVWCQEIFRRLSSFFQWMISRRENLNLSKRFKKKLNTIFKVL